VTGRLRNSNVILMLVIVRRGRVTKFLDIGSGCVVVIGRVITAIVVAPSGIVDQETGGDIGGCVRKELGFGRVRPKEQVRL
jgi:hypothetical protein